MRDGNIDLFATGAYLDRCSPMPRAPCDLRSASWSATASRFDTLLAIPF